MGLRLSDFPLDSKIYIDANIFLSSALNTPGLAMPAETFLFERMRRRRVVFQISLLTKFFIS